MLILLGRFVESERDGFFEAPRPRDEYLDAAAERVRGNPGLIRLGEALAGGLDGWLDALPVGGGELSDSASGR
jgi:hypothetical protein